MSVLLEVVQEGLAHLLGSPLVLLVDEGHGVGSRRSFLGPSAPWARARKARCSVSISGTSLPTLAGGIGAAGVLGAEKLMVGRM